MRTKIILIILGCLFYLGFGQGGGGENSPIKFYNLEKEYSKTITYAYTPKEASALELKQILANMLSIFGSIYVNEVTNTIFLTDTEEKIEDVKAILPSLDLKNIKAGNNLVSEVMYLKHENVFDVSSIIRHKLSGEGNLYEIANLNAMVVTDISSKIGEVKNLLEKIDVPNPQIAIEISVVEFNNEYFSKLGINIFDWLQGLNAGIDIYKMDDGTTRTSVTLQNKGEGPISTGGEFLISELDRSSQHKLRSEINISDLVNFINENADGAVLANSRIITRNNKQAILNAREYLPHQFFEQNLAEANPFTQLSLTGTTVRVTPTIQQDSMINLKIIPVVANLTGWSPKGMPIVFERSLDTEVKVKNNTIFALGGLNKKEKVKIRRGIPILKDIPLLRVFFSTQQDVVLEREVLIFIKPVLQEYYSSSEESMKNMMERFEPSKE